MIKKHYLIAGCALLVLLIFTGNVIETESKQNVPPSNIIDNEKTVGLVPIDTQGKDILEYQSLGLSNIQTACLEKEPTMENYIGQADAIVKGEVIAIDYFEYNNLPWSRLTVLVNDIIQGDIETSQKISIYVMEGYQYTDASAQYLVSVSGDEIGLHQIGETSIYVINQDDGSDIFEKGSYYRTFGCFSEYRYDKSADTYNIYDTKIASDLDEKSLEQKLNSFAK